MSKIGSSVLRRESRAPSTKKLKKLSSLESRSSWKFYKDIHGYRVFIVPKELLGDYSGMNFLAALQLGYTPIPAADEILISDDLKRREINETIIHEIIEIKLMKKSMSYWDAHIIALEKEKSNFTDV